MRLCRFNGTKIGIVEGDAVFDVTAAVLEKLPSCRYPLPPGDLLIANLSTLRPAMEAARSGAKSYALADVNLQSPVANPGKILAAPVNYRAHLEEARADAELHHQNRVEEIQRVGMFLKATSSLVAPSDGVYLRFPGRRSDHEIELVAVIGKAANKVSPADALDHVAGYCIGLDMTLRGPEERSLRKSIDSYSVIGPWLVTADEIDPANLGMELCVNGALRQKANTRDLIIALPELIAFASSFYTLYPGDILFTGTPEGVGPVVPGDRIDAEIDSIGHLTVNVRGD